MDYSQLTDEEINVRVAEMMGMALAEEYGFRYPDDGKANAGRESWGNSPEYTIVKCRNYGGRLLTRLRPPDGFSPATNIAHAWEVVVRLKGGGFSVVVDNAEDDFSASFVARGRHDAHGGVPHGLAHAPTAPRAICEAALRAAENET